MRFSASGTKYAASTSLHPSVLAAAFGDEQLIVKAKNAGSGGNSIVTSETVGNGLWGDTNLDLGSDTDDIRIQLLQGSSFTVNLDHDFALSHSLINPSSTLLSLAAVAG